MEKLIETRNEKAKKVIAAVKAASSVADSQEAIHEKNTPKLSPEERDERNKELRALKPICIFPVKRYIRPNF